MPQQKFPEAEARQFNRVFICMNCGARIKADFNKVRSGKVKCRKCRHKELRPIHRENR